MDHSAAHKQGLHLLSEGRPAEAVELLRGFTSDASIKDYPYCAYHFGKASAAVGNFQEAKAVFRRLLNADWLNQMSFEESPWFHLGVLDALEGKMSEAIENFMEGKRALPLKELFTDWRLFKWCGACHHQEGRFREAAENYGIAVGIWEYSSGSPPIDTPSLEALLMMMAIAEEKLTSEMLDVEPFCLDLKEDAWEALSQRWPHRLKS